MNNDLYSDLKAIGFRVTESLNKKQIPDIEETIIKALYTIDTDSRMFSLAFSWGKIHGEHLIFEKLQKYILEFEKKLGPCAWYNAFCAYMVELKINKFQKGIVKQKKEKWIGNREMLAVLKTDGAVDFLKKLNFIVPTSMFDISDRDILSIKELAKLNHQYRNRLRYGSNWRADIVYKIEQGISNPNQISKLLRVRYPTVRIVFKEFEVLKEISV